ncbi:MAG TPA: glycoside hydrolase family 3 N-terminal domain-containing protein [Thermoleophilaceae bacterium]|nr:glycoside hydrolase family 3 N-terminal domain-containing protein [Thermoleophilaceae bacterium]
MALNGVGRRIALALALVAIVAGVVAITASQQSDADRGASFKLPHLTVAQLAGLRVVASFRQAGAGRVPAALARRIRAGTIGAVCLFAQNGDTVATIRKLTRKLQAIPRPKNLSEPLLIMIDQEGGEVRRIADSPPAESALQMAASHNAAHIRAVGVATARGLRRAGVNVDLAPVSDIPRAGSTLLETKRTFGADPKTIPSYAAAFAGGLAHGGVVATAKHFPGFGAAKVNSDNESVTINLSAGTLRTVDEASFKSVVKGGARMVMVANAIYPALDRRAPATLSRRIATTEIRRRLGFTGVTITDDLEAGALKPYGSPGQIAVKSAAAGNDLVLFARNYSSSEQAAKALTAALRSGRLNMSEARAAAARILALRQSLAG